MTEKIREQQKRVNRMFAQDGIISRFAMTNPAGFYIDDRVESAALNRTREEIYTAVERLREMAVQEGLDPNNLPDPYQVEAGMEARGEA